MRALLALAVCLLLIALMTGCAPTYGDLQPPARVLMLKPKPFPTPKTGDDANEALVQAAEVHATNTRRQRRLQNYVRTILK